jgi:hypothetical protein
MERILIRGSSPGLSRRPRDPDAVSFYRIR